MNAQHVHLTDSQVEQIVSALLIARAQFIQDSQTLREHPALTEQFLAQANAADNLANLLQGADVVIT